MIQQMQGEFIFNLRGPRMSVGGVYSHTTVQWRIHRRGARGLSPLIFRLNWGPKGRKKLFLRPCPPFYRRVWITAPFISRSGSGTTVTSSPKLIWFQRKYQESLQTAQYILPLIEMSRPSRDHIAFSQISTAMSSLAYPYFKHDFKQDAKPKPSLTK